MIQPTAMGISALTKTKDQKITAKKRKSQP